MICWYWGIFQGFIHSFFEVPGFPVILYLREYSKNIFIFLMKIRRYGIIDEQNAISTSNVTCRYWYLDLGLHILLLLYPWISYYIVYEKILIKHHYLHDQNKMHGIKYDKKVFQFSNMTCWYWGIFQGFKYSFFEVPGFPVIL